MKLVFSTVPARNQKETLDNRGAQRRLLAFPALRTKRGAEYLRAVRDSRPTGGAA